MLLNSHLFYCKNKDIYPPFKNGLYMEEFFLKKIQRETPHLKRKYIPLLWTNFQIDPSFQYKKNEMQEILDQWILENPCTHGYFTIVQFDDGPQLKIPVNTIIYGACCGMVPIPLIYQDINYTLSTMDKIPFSQKTILCSFVGNITSNHVQPNVRDQMFSQLSKHSDFVLYNSGGWTPNINENLQQTFINITRQSKFALAPRGYGRGSFRFYECFQLGTIPIYIWNDYEWLPYTDIIDYNRLCVSIHVSQIDKLDNILKSITCSQYNEMFEYYEKIKHLFDLDGMSNYIIQHVNK